MPIYEYECRDCNHNFEVVESMKAEAQELCPACNVKSLFRVISNINFSVKGEPKTIGQLAESNWKKMGKYERDSKMAQDKIPEAMAKREKKKKLNKISNMTPEQKVRYIEGND